MLLLLQMGSFKVLTTLLRFRTLGRSHSWSCPSCCVPASSGDSTPTNTATSSSDSSTAQSGPPFLLMQQSRPIFAFKSYPPSAYLVSSPSASLPPLLASGCFSTPPASSSPPLNPSLGFFNGILAIFQPAAVNCYTFFRLIPLTLFVSRNLTSTYLPLFGSLDSLLCDLIATTPGVAFCFLMPHALAAESSFSSGGAYPFLNFRLPLFLCLTPTLIMWGSTSL